MTINPWSNAKDAGEPFEMAHIQRPLDVFGMPKEAIRAGAVDHVLSLNQIAAVLSQLHARIPTTTS